MMVHFEFVLHLLNDLVVENVVELVCAVCQRLFVTMLLCKWGFFLWRCWKDLIYSSTHATQKKKEKEKEEINGTMVRERRDDDDEAWAWARG